jgi:membrane-bound lytic murein transglycosylase D
MAAYNSGPGTIQSAVKRTGYADFWELYKRNVLPKETRNYVPIILAVTIMAKNPEQYGLDDVNPDDPAAFDSVKIDYAVDLRLVAQCVGASPETLQDLNPSLLRFTTPKDRPFELHLPLGTKDRYLEAIAAIPADMRVYWRYHKVIPGDTLASLARANHTTRDAIADANGMDTSAELRSGDDVVIPIAPGKQRSDDPGTYAVKATVYKVRRSDTVESVADNFGVSPSMVRRWNHLRGDSLSARRVIYIHLPVSARAIQTGRSMARKQPSHNSLHGAAQVMAVHHKVQPGETLYSIASSYNTTVTALKHDNGDLAILRPGMILLVHGQR